MARYAHGRDVYDDSNDEWTRHNTEDDAKAYCAEVDDAMTDPVVQIAASPRIAGSVVTIGLPDGLGAFTPTGSFVIASADPVRQSIRVGVSGGDAGSGIIVGSRSDVLSGKGYFIPSGDDIRIDSSAELWCAGYSLIDVTATQVVSVSSLQEYIS